MEQKIEKIKELKSLIMVELEKAEVLSKICHSETAEDNLKSSEISVILGIIHSIIIGSAKLNANIEQVLLENI
ncbi:MAG: hypothetical protein A2Y25_09790 [Candidatus Melainabacteria bacterium GWF2_37_15]|nr:MAG: hypothetical protein A2Y25_09790 [Candidatus Melainabacteria bacterium GWF2_37_15]